MARSRLGKEVGFNQWWVPLVEFTAGGVAFDPEGDISSSRGYNRASATVLRAAPEGALKEITSRIETISEELKRPWRESDTREYESVAPSH